MITSQRLSLARLQQWESLRYGMFIHYSMNTYDGYEFCKGDLPSSEFAPTSLDVEQWIRTAKEAGMRYAVLTTKHVAGFCLWPSRYTDYHVGNSPVNEDIVRLFVEACRTHGIRPGFYYCSWDDHNTFGRPSYGDDYFQKVDWALHHYPVSREYEDFQTAQITELLSNYGDIEEIWIDIPAIHSPGYRKALYDQCAELQPECLIIMNNGIPDKQGLVWEDTWPTDVFTIERNLPLIHGWDETIRKSAKGKWNPILNYLGKDYYVPAEVCDTLTGEWFYEEGDPLKHVAELAGMVNIANARGANMLLNVGPTPEGLIHPDHREALLRVRELLAFVE